MSRRWATAVLATALLVLLVVPAALVLVQQQRTQDVLLDRAQTRLAGVAGLASATVSNELASVSDVVAAWGSRPGTARDVATVGGSGRVGVREVLTALRLSDRSVDGAYALDDRGRLLLSEPAQPELYGQDFSGRDWFRGAVSSTGAYVSEAFHARALDQPWGVGVATAVRDGEGRTVGVVGALYRLDRVQGLVDQHASAYQLHTRVFDRRGVLVADTAGRPSRPQATTDPRVLAAAGGPRSGRTSGEGAVLWAAAPVGATGGTLLVELPEQTTVGGLRSQYRRTLAVLAGLLGLLVLSGALALRLERGRRRSVADLVQAREEAHDASALQRAVLAASPDLFFVVEMGSGAVVYATGSGHAVLGRGPGELVALGAGARAALVHPDDLPDLLRADARTVRLADGEATGVRLRARHADGRWVWLSRRTTPFKRDDDGEVVQLLGVARDVTDVVEAEARLQHAALHDGLTGLPNRTLLLDRLTTALDRARRTGRVVGVLYLDLDGFKDVNDSGGHAAGDAVLLEVAGRLTRSVRPEDTVARLGGDEFVVLLEPHPADGDLDEGNDRARVLAVSARVRAVVALPVVVDGVAHVVTASTGLTFGAGGPVSADEVLRAADAAMYRAKQRGKDRVEVAEQVGQHP